MHYHIIGTDHELQKLSELQKAPCPDTGLREKLKTVIQQNSVVLVAEEVNANENVLTFGRQLIGEGRWLSIDMTDQERKNAGIYEILRRQSPPQFNPATRTIEPFNAYFLEAETVRETFWLDKIDIWCKARHIREGVVILTCGLNHSTFVAEKVVARGHTFTPDKYMPYDYVATWGSLRVVSVP